MARRFHVRVSEPHRLGDRDPHLDGRRRDPGDAVLVRPMFGRDLRGLRGVFAQARPRSPSGASEAPQGKATPRGMVKYGKKEAAAAAAVARSPKRRRRRRKPAESAGQAGWIFSRAKAAVQNSVEGTGATTGRRSALPLVQKRAASRTPVSRRCVAGAETGRKVASVRIHCPDSRCSIREAGKQDRRARIDGLGAAARREM